MSEDSHLSFYRGRSVLVTGGVGSIGGRLTATLLTAGARVTVLDDLSSAARWNLPQGEGLRFIEGSILDEDAVAGAFADAPEIVFHLAARFANQNSIDHPEDDLLVNGLGTLRLLERAAAGGVQRLVFASSSSAFSDADAPLPLDETYLTDRLSTPYQITKLLGELYCNYFSGAAGLETVRMRFFNSYGPGEIPGRYRNVVPNFIYWALNGRPLPITGSGDETRDYTFVDDVVDGLLGGGLSDLAAGEAFNLAAGNEVPISELARMINELTGNSAGIAYGERRAWDRESRRLAATEKARNLLGFEAATPLAEGLARTVAWFRAHWEEIGEAADFASEPEAAGA